MSCKTFYWHYSYEISIFYNNIYWKINFYKKRSKNETLGYSFLSIFYWLCYYSCPIFSPLYSPLPCTFLPPVFSPLVHVHGSMGHTYKFFDFSISYTILNLTLSILYLPFMLLIPCNFLKKLKFAESSTLPNNPSYYYMEIYF